MKKSILIITVIIHSLVSFSQSFAPTNPSFTSNFGGEITFNSFGIGYIAYTGPAPGYKLQVEKWNGASWSTIGLNVSNGIATNITIIPGIGDTIYVCYRDQTPDIITVKQYDGTTWSNLGSASLAPTFSYDPSLARNTSNGDLYLSFTDGSQSGKITLKKWTGTTWATQGIAGYTSSAYGNKLKYSPVNNKLFTFITTSNHPRLYEKHVDSTNWINLGNVNGSAHIAYSSMLDIETHPTTGIPYIIFTDNLNNNRATVYSYQTSSSSYIHVGTPSSVTSGSAYYSSMIFDNNGELYISYASSQSATGVISVSKFNATSGAWSVIKPQVFRTSRSSNINFNDKNTLFVLNEKNVDTLSCNSTKTLNIDQCLSYTSPSGKIWAMDGIYMDTLPNLLGCDSIITINLNVYTETRDTIITTVCGEFIAPSGKRYGASGIYGDTVVGTMGCDSVYVIDLTVVIEDKVITPSSTSVCGVGSVNVTVNNSQINTFYELYDSTTGTQIGTAQSGNGSNLIFNTGNVSATNTYQIKAIEDQAYLIDSNAVKFGGSRDRAVITIPNSGAPTLRSNWTMEAWVKLANNTGAFGVVKPIFSISGATNTCFDLYYSPWNGRIEATRRVGSSFYGPWTFNGSSYVPINQDFHLAVTFNSSTEYLTLYINGVMINSYRVFGAYNVFTSIANKELVLGDVKHSAYNGISQFNGEIDDFRFWQKLKTPAQILGDSKKCSDNLLQSSLRVYLELDEGTGTNFTNSIGGSQGTFENHGTLTNWVDGVFSCTNLPTACERILTNIKITAGGSNTSSSPSITSCSASYTSPSGKIWTSAGIYQDTIINTGGCDSVMTIQLTMNSSTAATLFDTICSGNSYTSPSGKTITTAGTYMDTIPNASACDSIITINLTVNAVNSVTVSAVTTCGTTGQTPFTVSVNSSENGVIYSLRDSISGSTIVGVPTISGNGSSVSFSSSFMNRLFPITLEVIGIKGNCQFSMGHVTIYPKVKTYNSYTVNSCTGSFTSPTSGKIWTTTGIYLDTLVGANQYGCDSISGYNLTVGNKTTETLTVARCNSYSTPSGKIVMSSGTIMDTINNASGCDSVITINLTINNSTTNAITISACTNYTSASGKVWSTSGTYLDTISNTSGCDSVITVSLTITTINSGLSVSSSTGGAKRFTSLEIGAAYQWLDCNNAYAPVSGATSISYTPTLTGDYAVEITQNRCVDTSSCSNYTNTTSIGENEKEALISVYPNPTSNILNIDSKGYEIEEIRIFDVSGKLLLTDINPSFTVDVSKFKNGLYLIQIETENGIALSRFIKN